MNRPFLPAVLLLSAALWPVFFLQTIGVEIADRKGPYAQTIVRAEFLKTEADVYDLFGAEPSNGRRRFIQHLHEANAYDNVFLVLYSLFFISFAHLGYRLTRKWYFLAMIVLAGLAGVGDFYENLSIARIAGAVESGGHPLVPLLRSLAWFTWQKWLCLALYFGLAGFFFWNAARLGRMPDWAGKILAIGGGGVCVLAFAALRESTPAWESAMAAAVAVWYLVLLLFSLFFRGKTAVEG